MVSVGALARSPQGCVQERRRRAFCWLLLLFFPAAFFLELSKEKNAGKIVSLSLSLSLTV